MQAEKIILGIDPGTNIMGYGLIACTGSKYKLIDLGTLHMSKVKEPMDKLQLIFKETSRLITEFGVHELAIEEPFYGKNIQSMLKLGRAQGMAIAAAIHENIPVYQYAARKIKQSITGNGASSKEQVAGMLQHLLGLKEIPEKLDATDGLSVAVCHFYQNGTQNISSPKYNSWQNFLSQNPDRIK
ncbi:MAG: crossover junction endodeoxyribonuclease RuvC [Sphingobacteriales bacterium]|nr:MAG: crossover junction endodeoxyribonuclease RuvC [Sphingobacteriales bacterium]